MNLEARPPLEKEWPICRMLLPETFADASAREYLLWLRDEAPHTVAAASFRRTEESLTGLRLHVLPSFRRRGVGSRIVEHLAGGGARSIEGTVDIVQESAAARFCERNGFERVDGLTTVEAEIAEMREHLRRLRARAARVPGVRTIAIREAPIEQVARLHARFVAHGNEPDRWRARLAERPEMDRSLVTTVDGGVAGILLWELQGEIAVVRSLAVEPLHRAGWVSTVLLADALDAGWESGARRVQFSYNDSNRQMRRLAARFRAEVVSVVVHFLRRADSAAQ